MRTPCELLSPSKVAKGQSGEDRFIPESIGDIWCRVASMGGRRAEVAARLAPEASHVVLVRYDARIKPGMALRFRDGRVFTIDHTMGGNPSDPNVSLELFCREGVLRDD